MIISPFVFHITMFKISNRQESVYFSWTFIFKASMSVLAVVSTTKRSVMPRNLWLTTTTQVNEGPMMVGMWRTQWPTTVNDDMDHPSQSEA